MARCSFAQWQGSPNDYQGGMDAQPMGVVLHIEQGYETGTVSEFHNPGAQASAHFGVGKDGHIDQFVDTNDAAWAEVAGNRHWISIEHEGFSGESLTLQQVASDARLVAWLKGHEGGPAYNFPLSVTDDINTPGLGWHGMGGDAWGGHFNCPGDPVKAQRQTILAEAGRILGGNPPTPPPPVVWPPAPHPIPHPVPPGYVPPWPGRMIHQPPIMNGADVRTWQAKMAARGWTITVDGAYGPASESVCKQFQAEKHLGVDGIVGPITWHQTWIAPVT